MWLDSAAISNNTSEQVRTTRLGHHIRSADKHQAWCNQPVAYWSGFYIRFDNLYVFSDRHFHRTVYTRSTSKLLRMMVRTKWVVRGRDHHGPPLEQEWPSFLATPLSNCFTPLVQLFQENLYPSKVGYVGVWSGPWLSAHCLPPFFSQQPARKVLKTSRFNKLQSVS